MVLALFSLVVGFDLAKKGDAWPALGETIGGIVLAAFTYNGFKHNKKCFPGWVYLIAGTTTEMIGYNMIRVHFWKFCFITAVAFACVVAFCVITFRPRTVDDP